MNQFFLASIGILAITLPASAITVNTPVNGTEVTSPFKLVASTDTCDSKRAVTMGYSIDYGETTITKISFSAMLIASEGPHILHVKCWGPGGAIGHENLNITVVSVTGTTAAPKFSVPAGAYTSAQLVALTDATAGAAIYFTMDESVPTASSYRYVNAIPVSSNETIKAIAVASGHSSAVASARYTVTTAADAPKFSVPAGTYTAAQVVALSGSTPGTAVHYTLDGTAPTASSALYTSPIKVSTSKTITAIAVAAGYSNSNAARAAYAIKQVSARGPVVPTDAINATELQAYPHWRFAHDPGTPGTAFGSKKMVGNPSLSGNAVDFDSGYSNYGGEIYHLTFGLDAVATNFVYDAQIYIADGSEIGNLEMDMNQVIPNGDTVIYGFQCDGDHGTWDYSANVNGLGSHISWRHSAQPCNPAKWARNAWHHMQISYSRDEVGNVTYHSVWFDGVEAPINATVPTAESLHWAHGDLLTNFQVDGVKGSAASVVYVDNLTISRW